MPGRRIRQVGEAFQAARDRGGCQDHNAGLGPRREGSTFVPHGETGCFWPLRMQLESSGHCLHEFARQTRPWSSEQWLLWRVAGACRSPSASACRCRRGPRQAATQGKPQRWPGATDIAKKLLKVLRCREALGENAILNQPRLCLARCLVQECSSEAAKALFCKKLLVRMQF